MQAGDRVFYSENGPSDTGTILKVLDDGWFKVKWDNNGEDALGGDDDEYSTRHIELVK